jgi:hypothetical protein
MKFDIIIQAGQSNAEGCGVGPVEREYIPTDKVWQLDALKKVTALPNGMDIVYLDEPFLLKVAEESEGENGKVGNFGLTFSEEYIKAGMLEEDRAILIVRAGVGGTGFARKEWGLGSILYNKLTELVDYALSLNEENKVVALLWHQGECDSAEKNPPEKFGEALTEQMLDIRKRYGDMPIVAGDFVNEWKSKNIELCDPIVAKIKEVLAGLGKADFIETADLPSNNQKTGNGDDIHFCRQSQHILGRRYFNTFKNL